METAGAAELSRVDRLGPYLNDHLAGGNAAIRLAERCARHAAQPRDREDFAGLVAEIREDRTALRDVMSRLGIATTSAKQATALGVEALGSLRHRLPVVGSGSSEVRALEEIELLSLGVEGKLLMWRVLASLENPRLDDVDLDELQKRARAQRRLLERHRLRLATEAFTA